MDAVIAALETAGIEFTDGGGPGLRLRETDGSSGAAGGDGDDPGMIVGS